MRRWATVAALVVLGVVAVDLLADATQTRPDQIRPGSRTAVTLEVDLRDDRPALTAAEGLWGACQWMVRSRTLVEPGIEPLGADRFRLTLSPELGRRGEMRLRGCLEDFTIDRVRAQVVAMETFAPASP
ncbi:hypothetical protein BH20ACT2_BH20ACT2_25040 [soil metagenome]